MSSRTPQETPRDTAGHMPDTSQRSQTRPIPGAAVDMPANVTARHSANQGGSTIATAISAARDSSRRMCADVLTRYTNAVQSVARDRGSDATVSAAQLGLSVTDRASTRVADLPEKYESVPTMNHATGRHPATDPPLPTPPAFFIRVGGTLTRPFARHFFLSPRQKHRLPEKRLRK
jgi:hypothetical protein